MDKTLRQLTEELTLRDQQLHESEKLFKSIFCLNPVPMSLTNLEGVFIKVNRALTDLLNKKENDVLGSSVKELNIYEYSKTREDLIDELLTKGCIKNRSIIFNKNEDCKINCSLYTKIVTYNCNPHILAVILVKDEICE